MSVSNLSVRRQASDDIAAVRVLRRSISELCLADHGGDRRKIAGWLANKTAAQWRVWVNRVDAIVLVALRDDAVVGVGMMDDRGEILLNYVDPDARFCGVSVALLDALERQAREMGLTGCVLESTLTARRFYAARGYAPLTPDGLQMEKGLAYSQP